MKAGKPADETAEVVNKEGEREKASSPLDPLLGKEKGEENTDIDIRYPISDVGIGENFFSVLVPTPSQNPRIKT